MLIRQTHLQIPSLVGSLVPVLLSLPFPHLESSPAPPQAPSSPGPWEGPALQRGPCVFPVGPPDSRYIRVETCMFMIKLPQYSSLEIMLDKLRCAIHYREDPLSG